MDGIVTAVASSKKWLAPPGRDRIEANMQLIEQNRCFDGEQHRYRHASGALGCDMLLSVYLPPRWRRGSPVLYWLSGLTCTDQNFVHKAGAQRVAAELGMILVVPDTSPRGDDVADDDAYDLGQGAGFYVNATQAPWASHFRMEDYIVDELPALVRRELGLSGRWGVSGHSMGGHGAISLALRHPGVFHSVSAFSPIANPTACPWGQKALGAYLGDDSQTWQEHDSALLLAHEKAPWPILVDVGTSDGFLAEQLKPEALEAAAKRSSSALYLNRREGYDHSYFFVQTFIEDHLRFHAEQLG